MSEPTILIVKHMPFELSVENQEEILKLYGAKKVRCMPSEGKFKGVAFATFATHEEAKHALNKLHQLELLGQRLVVEYVKKQHMTEVPKESDFPHFKMKQVEEAKPTRISDKEILRQEAEDFSKKIHGVCPALGLDYLSSTLLKYKYPQPTPSIIANISHALVAVPKFYVQVLHLMNKMCLPPPFGPVTPAPPLSSDPVAVSQEPHETYGESDKLEVEEMETGSEEESEIESDHDNTETVKFPVKRTIEQKKKRQKKPKFHQLIPSTVSHKSSESRTEPSDVFELNPQLESQKKIQFNIKPNFDHEQTKSNVRQPDQEQSGFGLIEAPKRSSNSNNSSEELEKESSDSSSFITYDELKQKRISQREMRTMSVFKNYHPGEPTVCLYIKNLARQVEEKDLRYIFGRFIDWSSETDKNMFSIQLMKKGRMKGQAFVILANEEQASEAVKETNGFILHTKPLVVQFARCAKPKEAPVKAQTKNT